MNLGMFSTRPISPSILSAASLAPPWAGPQRQAMPAAMQANGLAPEDPARRTVEVGVQDKDAVERPRQDGVHLVLLARDREAHAQEIRRVIELVLRIDERLA